MNRFSTSGSAFGVGVLTSTDTRHCFVARTIARRFPVVAVGYQNTAYDPSDRGKYDIDERTARILERHFEDRARTELQFFGHEAERFRDSPEISVRDLDVHSLNSAETVGWLQDRGVSAVAVFGTSLIKAPLLDAYAGRLINMHLGLSPYYRGTATNFYPLVNGEPQFVGATVHLIDAGIDSGPILHHARPMIEPDDQPHTVGCKAILAGLDKLLLALEELVTRRLRPVAQWPVPNAKLYLRKDYHPNQVVRLYENMERGLLRTYRPPANEPVLIP